MKSLDRRKKSWNFKMKEEEKTRKDGDTGRGDEF